MATTSNDALPEYIAPPDPPGPIKWLRDNFFGSLFNSLLTIVSFGVLSFILYTLINWAAFEADWTPVIRFPVLFAVGQYPREELWRVGASLSLIIFLFGLSWGKWGGLLGTISMVAGAFLLLLAILPVDHPQLTLNMRLYLGGTALLTVLGYFIGRIKALPKPPILVAWLLTPVIIPILLNGFGDSQLLPEVSTVLWGGLLVTMILSVGGIVLSFPIGVLLALGRRSSLPVVSAFSTIFIEAIRGVPLITLLFMFSVILALFLPPEARIDRLVRALMAVTFFSAAYTAENVRGGLQAVPEGQIEAAKAIGMNGFQTMIFIVLPQAIRAVLPAIVGQFIALFKDTTLVVIVGINDFLGIGRSVINSSPEFVQLQLEVYLFIAVVYMIFSYLMSMASRQLEARLGVGER